MANPVPVSYSSPAQKVGGGREVFPNRLLNLLAGIADGQWVKANTNTFDSIRPSTKTPNYGPGSGTERSVINAWSSIAWDSKRHRICLWGGGHANTDDSALYIWDGNSGEWMVGYYTPEVILGDDPSADKRTKDGHLKHPISSHVYAGNQYLPVLDRFYTQGGAAEQNANGFRYHDGTAYRNIAGYLCQLDLAGQGFVGGATGNNWIRTGGKALPGAQAWEVLDYIGEGVPVTFTGAIAGGADVRIENGVDVIYKVGTTYGVKNLRKITMPSLDITTHTIEHIGRVWSQGLSEDIGCAIDHATETMVLCGATGERFWDLKTPGPTNEIKTPTFVETAVRDQFVSDRYLNLLANQYCVPGVASDPSRTGIFVWVNGGKVYRITPPSGNPTPTAGWHIEVAADETVTRPMTAVEVVNSGWRGSVWGKFKYASDLDAYVGMQHPVNGDVWLWRPPGWADPRI